MSTLPIYSPHAGDTTVPTAFLQAQQLSSVTEENTSNVSTPILTSQQYNNNVSAFPFSATEINLLDPNETETEDGCCTDLCVIAALIATLVVSALLMIFGGPEMFPVGLTGAVGSTSLLAYILLCDKEDTSQAEEL